MSSRGWRTVGVVVALGLLATGAVAQDGGASADDGSRWMLFVGGFFPDVDSGVTVNDPELGVSRPIDFEDFGLDSEVTALRLGAAYRLSRNGRHLIELEYLRIDRDGRLVLEEDLEFGEEVFPVGVDVKGQVNTEDLDIHYVYNVLKSDRGYLGLAVGIHALRFEASADGTVRVGGGQPIVARRVERYADDFPLPLVGLRAGYELVDNLVLTGGFKWLALSIDEYDGSFTDAWLRLEYRLLGALAVGVGLARIDVDYDRDLDETKREIIDASYTYSGLEGFLRFRF